MNQRSKFARPTLARTGWTACASVGALTLALMSYGAPAAAQDAEEPEASELEEVVVTGFRASLANALNIKRREAGVVDAISAEDIADFPDTNLAESIQRIPGVSIDRDAGEGRTITVRGLSSEFTRTRINGIEAQATTAATDSSGSVNRGRGFDFNVFASELFNNITVRKTASAEVEEGSLGATVDLRTSRPFDRPGFNAAASVQGGYNDLSQSWSPRFAGLVSNTWMDGQFGALFSLAYSDKDSIEEGFSSVRWGPASQDGGFQNPAVLLPAAANTLFHPRIPRYGRLNHEQERIGATLSLQWRPSDQTTFSFDNLYSQLNSTRAENFLEAWSLSRGADQGGKPQVDIIDVVVDPVTGEMIYMRLDDMDMRTEQRFDVLETTYTQHTLEIDHRFSDTLRFNGTIGRSKSDFANPSQISAIIDHQNGDGWSIDFRQNRDLPLIVYGFDVTDPNQWTITGPTTAGAVQPVSELRISSSFQTNTYTTFEGSLAWDLDDVLTIKGGLSYKEFESVGTGYARRTNVLPSMPAGTTMSSITQLLTGFGRNLDLPAGSATSWITPDLDAIMGLYGADCLCNTSAASGDFSLLGLENGSTALGSWRTVTEADTGAWVQADWDSYLGNVPFRGNIGVRWVRTEVEALGYTAVNTVTTPFTDTNEYDDFLPSLNMSFELKDDVILRLGAARVMARPPVTNLVPAYTVSAIGAASRTVTRGNTDLEPYRANTFDLSLEWYFAPEALLSFAYFYKDISTYVQTTNENITYGQLNALNPAIFPLVTGRDAADVYVLSTPRNTPGGPLKGFEISYQQPFTFLPGIWENFGVQANYTHVESEISYCTTSTCNVFAVANLVNLSPEAWNGTLYYDDGRLNARVSAAYRDSYYQQVPAANGGGRGVVANGKSETLSIDASASFALNDQITLTLEGINLTDEANRQNHGELDGIRDSTYVYHHTGRQVMVGARYRF